MNSIFQRANPAIEKIFRDGGSPRKVMCIPIDYAKAHTASAYRIHHLVDQLMPGASTM